MVERERAKEIPDSPRIRAISLGWGTQSFGLAAMSALGDLPKVDVAIFADTNYERTATYDFAARWAPWLEEHGIQVVTVRDEPATQKLVDPWGGVYIPAFTTDEAGNPTGTLQRQCTYSWKIAPVRRWLQTLIAASHYDPLTVYLLAHNPAHEFDSDTYRAVERLHRRGIRNLKRSPGVVELWLGITLDEAERLKPSDVQYIVNVHPYLRETDPPYRFLEKKWTRGEVVQWLARHGLEVPPRSACTFCPYHSQAEWRELKLSAPEDFAEAVRVDERIRHKRPGYRAYLTAERRPLAEVDFRTAEDHGQVSLWNNECEGLCGL